MIFKKRTTPQRLFDNLATREVGKAFLDGNRSPILLACFAKISGQMLPELVLWLRFGEAHLAAAIRTEGSDEIGDLSTPCSLEWVVRSSRRRCGGVGVVKVAVPT